MVAGFGCKELPVKKALLSNTSKTINVTTISNDGCKELLKGCSVHESHLCITPLKNTGNIGDVNNYTAFTKILSQFYLRISCIFDIRTCLLYFINNCIIIKRIVPIVSTHPTYTYHMHAQRPSMTFRSGGPLFFRIPTLLTDH